LRYPSDVTDAEWDHIACLIPLAKRSGRKRTVDVREVVNGLMYVLSTGCQWRSHGALAVKCLAFHRWLSLHLDGGAFDYPRLRSSP